MQVFEIYALLPLTACLVNALSALAIWLRGPNQRTNQIATALTGLAAWWGFCQVLWSVAEDAETAYFWHHLAGPGWAFIGPLALHLIAQHTRAPRFVNRALPVAYATGVLWAVLQLSTSWLHASAFPTPWGWGFEAGPLHSWFLVSTFACVIPAIIIAVTRVKRAAAPAERRQLRLIAIGISAPFFLAGLTGGLLPLLGVQMPRLGSISFAVLGAVVAYSHYRYGFSALAPGMFSSEIIETLPSGLALVGLDGEILNANNRLGELLGLDADEMPGFSIGAALSPLALTPPREVREVECKLTPPGAAESFPVAVSTSLLQDRRGLPIGIVLVVHDRREVVELRNHLVMSGRLAAVGELAAGIAHEINNPIAFIRANLSQLQRDWVEISKQLPDGVRGPLDGVDLVSEGEELIQECIEGVERTVQIVRSVKGFAHGGTNEREPVDLNALIERSLRVAQSQLWGEVSVERNLASIPPILGCAAELQQVFLNLLVNALQAVDTDGTIRISTASDQTGVSVRVSDDGAGISAADLERIFDPFFTTKPVGEGTGLGLAISFQIVKAHDGQILVDSELGIGTCFTVRLPKADDAGSTSLVTPHDPR